MIKPSPGVFTGVFIPYHTKNQNEQKLMLKNLEGEPVLQQKMQAVKEVDYHHPDKVVSMDNSYMENLAGIGIGVAKFNVVTKEDQPIYKSSQDDIKDDDKLDRTLDEIEDKYKQMIKVARERGHDVATDNLERFLDGVEGTVYIDSQWLRTFSSTIKAQNTNNRRFEKTLEAIAYELKDGEKREFNDFWDRMETASIFTELYYTSGTFTLTSTGNFVLAREGEKITIEGTVIHKWWDPYDWHQGLAAYILGFGTVSDSDALLLEEHRGAKGFMMESIWEQKLVAEIIIRKTWFDRKKFNWQN